MVVGEETSNMQSTDKKATDSSSVADRLEAIVNFRDAASISGGLVKPGLLYRSGHCLGSTEADADLILRELGVKTVLDLRRGDDELRKSKSLGLQDAVNSVAENCHKLAPFSDGSDSHHIAAVTSVESAVAAYVPLGGAKQIFWYTLWVASFMQRLQLLLFACMCLRTRVVNVIAAVFNKIGLFGYNEAIITYNGKQIAKALHIIALRAHNPILCHCTLGKDRTGLVIALVLRILEVPIEAVVQDYVLSEETTTKEYRHSMLPSIMKTSFVGAEANTIISTFQMIDRQYGSLNAYLDSIGFGAEWRHMLRYKLLATTNTEQ